MSFTSDKEYEYERHYLAHLQDDIDRDNAEKLKLQAKLAVTRRELANYIKYGILKEEDYMFCVIDKEKAFTPVKSGFKTSAQANNWAKKNLPKDDVHLWGAKLDYNKPFRYFIQMK